MGFEWQIFFSASIVCVVSLMAINAYLAIWQDPDNDSILLEVCLWIFVASFSLIPASLITIVWS